MIVDTTNTNNQNEETEIMHEQPPAYEHPPGYEEINSLKIDMSPNRSRLQSSYKQRDSRSKYVQCTVLHILNLSIKVHLELFFL